MHFLQNRQKVHPTLDTRAEPGTGRGAAVLQWAQQRHWLFSLSHPAFLPWKWSDRGGKRGLEILTSHPVRTWAGTPWEGLALPG